MWKHCQINGNVYFLRCHFTAEEVKFVLYDFDGSNTSWWESQDEVNILQRVKKLNKRIEYDASTIQEALQNEEPVQASLEETDANTILKLKYRVRGCPFHFEWYLRKQTTQEFKDSIILPLLTINSGMSKQIKELCEIVRKKDAEIAEYRLEGVVLKRTTLETQPFSLLDFNEKYSKINCLGAGFAAIAKHHSQRVNLQNNDGALKVETANVNITPKKEKSPQKRKRRMLEMRQLQIQNTFKPRSKQKITYEDSQSLSEELLQESPAPKKTKQSKGDDASTSKSNQAKASLLANDTLIADATSATSSATKKVFDKTTSQGLHKAAATTAAMSAEEEASISTDDDYAEEFKTILNAVSTLEEVRTRNMKLN